jgi:CheY-like chemotaxis protein
MLPAAGIHSLAGSNADVCSYGQQIMSDSPKVPTILVMDDDEDVRFIAELMLSRLGFAVVPATRGTEAIERYREALDAGIRFHAVILDINIPGSMGGGEVLGRLKEIDPQVKAFISSGNPFDPLMVNPAAFGFAGAIAKPFLIEKLRILLPQI